jgi:hypothetical protein
MTTHEGETRENEMRDDTARADDQQLLVGDDSGALGDRWQQIQAQFVDNPREAVKEADSLVQVVLHRGTRGFADERRRLEEQWDGGEDVSTEDLRMALQRYRAFFGRLLSV